MAQTHIIGFPTVGDMRQTKKAVEKYWKGTISQNELLAAGQEQRQAMWRAQQGLDFTTVNDFAWYDRLLDMSVMLGVIPSRFGLKEINIDTMFRMARGRAPTGIETQACEMTKWFDTNYHYIVPEFQIEQKFKLCDEKLFNEVKEAQALGKTIKPTIIGPLTFLYLGKTKADEFDKLTLLENLVPVYIDLLERLNQMGVEWVQVEEPILALDLPQAWRVEFERVYYQLGRVSIKILLATYFGSVVHQLSTIAQLPVEGLHIDLVRAPEQLVPIVDRLSSYQTLSCGVVDGRNIWRSNLNKIIDTIAPIYERHQGNLWIAPSCSLLHVPVDLDHETKLDSETRQWFAFAKQKIEEVSIIAKALKDGKGSVAHELELNQEAVISRQRSSRIHKNEIKEKVASIDQKMASRQSEYEQRASAQRKHLNLPLYPTTTIGSFPQTAEIRVARKQFKSGELNESDYNENMRTEVKHAVAQQEMYGLDVLVHGEPERNDMVEYFGELLEGVTFTQNGWVQSYGSRCVKPPIIYGDIERLEPMTVEWSQYAASLTNKPMKGMLTGPVTILCWSFVRDDQPRETTAMQLALALRDEVCDLEKAGIHIIQIDEPAFREGLPLRDCDKAKYLDWAVQAFKVSACGVQDQTQIHTHMCYSEFNELIEYIAKMDADVITIETSRSDMELLQAFEKFAYPNEIGPGVYDIHSPNVPTVDSIVELMLKAAQYIPAERLWVNPDCGLKTRGWEETEEALRNMVQAAKKLRVKAQVTAVADESKTA